MSFEQKAEQIIRYLGNPNEISFEIITASAIVFKIDGIDEMCAISAKENIATSYELLAWFIAEKHKRDIGRCKHLISELDLEQAVLREERRLIIQLSDLLDSELETTRIKNLPLNKKIEAIELKYNLKIDSASEH